MTMRKRLLIFTVTLLCLCVATARAQESGPNRVLSLDGDGDYVEVADSESLNAINSQVTVEAWIKAAKFTGMAPIVFKGDKIKLIASNRSYYLFLGPSGSIGLGSAASGQQERIRLDSMNELIALNTWYHVAGVVDTESGVMRILINGVEVARRDSGRDIYMSALPLWIGWSHEALYSPFAGQMDEVRIWNVARTQEEIRKTMHTTLSGKEPGLVGYWRFDATGDTVTGSSPGSADGKLIGDAHLAEAELPEPGNAT
jgi:hypothetical protein